MDTQRAGMLIKKINSLFNSLDLDEGQLSSIERDLMLKYVRDLYDLFLDSNGTIKLKKKKNKKGKSDPAVTLNPSTTFQHTPKPKNTPPPPPKVEVIPEPAVEVELETKTQVIPPPPPPPVTTKPPSRVAPSGKLEQLFAFSEAKELSEKLSLQPITDLNSALSINDKLLYTNELFGRQHQTLIESLNTLNRFQSMGEAKGFLLNLAEQNQWGDSEKMDIARSFIKTVRRKFI